MEILKKVNFENLNDYQKSKLFLKLVESIAVLEAINTNYNCLFSVFCLKKQITDRLARELCSDILKISWNFEQLTEPELDILKQMHNYLKMPNKVLTLSK